MIYERNKIAPISVFFLLYISRAVICLTNVQTTALAEHDSDIMISLIISMGLTLCLSLPVLLCCKYKKNPFKIKWLSRIYFAYFVFTSALSISRFAYFSSTTLNPEARSIIFVIIIVISAWYAAFLGLEALSRFSAFAFILMLLAVLTVLLFNTSEFREINIYPLPTGSVSSILENALIISSNTSELIVFLCISDRVNGRAIKPFVFSITASFITILALLYCMFGSLGDGAGVQDFPIYTLFQIAKLSELQRLDVLHISFWISGVFIRVALSTYCAAISLDLGSNRKSTIASAVCIFAMSVVLSLFGTAGVIPSSVIIVSFAVFCVLIPLATLIFKRRSSKDEILEGF